MADPRSQARWRLFFIVGPLRTGSSLMARCIDDHEDAICLCESEINRTLFPIYALKLHVQRMAGHGFSVDQVIDLLDRRRPNHVEALLGWYGACLPVARAIYDKPDVLAFGDKSPDFYDNPSLVAEMAARFPLVYTVRDPRAVLRSIRRQANVSEAQKAERWENFVGNIRAWRPHWDRPNLLASRYEDLVRDPQDRMSRVYRHLGLRPSGRFLEQFPRKHPRRFLWETNVDISTGAARPFDRVRSEVSEDELPPEDILRLRETPDIGAYCERFGYSP